MTDLSKLQTLTLHCSNPEVLRYAAANVHFKSLKRLVVYFEPDVRDEDFGPAAQMFFEGLNPLTTQLHGSLDDFSVTKILDKHGGTLRKLAVETYNTKPSWTNFIPAMEITPAAVLHIRNRCPLLEPLGLRIRRLNCTSRETQCYEALGTFPLVVKLFLTLEHCNTGNPDTVDESDDASNDFYKQLYSPDIAPPLYNAHIRNAIVNSDVDETLARLIWCAISINKKGRPLTRLTITNIRRSTRSCHAIKTSLPLTRSQRDDSDHVEIVRLGKKGEENVDEIDRSHEAQMI